MRKIENIKEIYTKENESWLKWYEENYDYYEIEEDKILEIKKGKGFSITKDLWYDDETDAPEITLETFKRYNENNNRNYDVKGNYEDYYIVLTKCRTEDEKTIYSPLVFSKDIVIGGRMIDYCRQNREHIEGLNVDFDFEKDWHKEIKENDEIVKEIFELIIKENEYYENRLEKYFKRYGKNISARGYWANR